MILSFADKDTERFSNGERVRAFEAVERAAQLKLAFLKSAESLTDVSRVGGNRLEKLTGNRAGQYSIRVNDQWRICFIWNSAKSGFAEVELVDYHS